MLQPFCNQWSGAQWRMTIMRVKVLSVAFMKIQDFGDLMPFTSSVRFAGGTRWRGWLGHCATSRKITSSIPDCVIGIFHWHYPSGRTMALGGKGGRCGGLTTSPPSCADCPEIWVSHPPGILMACPGLQWDFFNFYLYLYVRIAVISCAGSCRPDRVLDSEYRCTPFLWNVGNHQSARLNIPEVLNM